jgi:hypothetical protein
MAHYDSSTQTASRPPVTTGHPLTGAAAPAHSAESAAFHAAVMVGEAVRLCRVAARLTGDEISSELLEVFARELLPHIAPLEALSATACEESCK